MRLKNKYEKIVEQYLIAFVDKQELDIDNCYWIADRIGEILSVNEQYYLNFNDIRFDVDNNVKDGLIFRWQDEWYEESYPALAKSGYFKVKTSNYNVYSQRVISVIAKKEK